MTKKEITEGNKLISEFIGRYGKGENISECEDDIVLSIKRDGFSGAEISRKTRKYTYADLQYHKSWSWIMPVLTKISEDFDVSVSSCGMWACFISRKDVEDGEISSMGGLEPIENIWCAIVQFIKWYNKQPKYSELPHA